MHELGIINYVVKQVEKLCDENDLQKVASITLEFGEVSGVVTSYLMDYWKWYKQKFPRLAEAELICETLPAVTWCDGCQSEYPTVEFGKICPKCGSDQTWLLHGQEMNIKEIVAE